VVLHCCREAAGSLMRLRSLHISEHSLSSAEVGFASSACTLSTGSNEHSNTFSKKQQPELSPQTFIIRFIYEHPKQES